MGFFIISTLIVAVVFAAIALIIFRCFSHNQPCSTEVSHN